MSKRTIANRLLRSRRGVLSIIELSFILPLTVGVVLAVAAFSVVGIGYGIVSYAAWRGAKVSSSSTIADKAGSYGNLITTLNNPDVAAVVHDQGVRPIIYGTNKVSYNQCRDTTTVDDASDCITVALASGGMSSKVWKGYSTSVTGNDWISAEGSQLYPLPFDLYDEYSTALPGYSRVQYFNQVQIRRACFEPFNETGGMISIAMGQLEVGADADGCDLVRPMTYYTNELNDFDGDKRADIVLFRPQGTSTEWVAPSSDLATTNANVDFIVMLSGSAYSAAGGHLFFNLTTASADATVPEPLPVVADYDGDGRADFAVFEPATGILRIAFSSKDYRIVGTLNMGVSDESGELGLFAIPGAYETAGAMQLAVGQTGGAAEERFNLFVSSRIVIPADASPPLTNVALAADITLYDSRSIKPLAARSAVPAFADYNQDGIKEIGYLTWRGGSLSRQVGGLVRGLVNPTATEIYPDSGATGETGMDVRMNPFDMEIHGDNLYWVDSVDSRVWQSAIEYDARGGATLGATTVVVNSATQVRDTSDDSIALAFPHENVWNISLNPEAADDGCNFLGTSKPETLPARCDITASSVNLNSPRQIAFDAGGNLYIADWGNKRVLRINSPVSGTSSVDLVLDSGYIENYLEADLGAGAGASFYPQALTVTRSSDGRDTVDNLAISAGYGVIMVTDVQGEGSSGWSIKRVAGDIVTPPPALSVTHSQITSLTSLYVAYLPVALQGNLDGFTANAIAQRFCPIVSMDTDYSTPAPSIVAASSCSFKVSETDTNYHFPDFPASGPPQLRSAGAVFRFKLPESSVWLDENAELHHLVGHQFIAPCTLPDLCGFPASYDGEAPYGVYKRKVHLPPAYSVKPAFMTQFAHYLDIENPVEVKVEPAIGGQESNILFVNQWNQGLIEDLSATGFFPIAPRMATHSHEASIYRIHPRDIASGYGYGIEPVTGRQWNGEGSIPILSADWFSPYKSGGSIENYIRAFEAPAMNVPFPATAGLALDTTNGNLFAATPYLVPPAEYDCDGTPTVPYCQDPRKIGFVYRMRMDIDGDGAHDYSSDEPDSDGDGVPNTDDAETCPVRSIPGGPLQMCRIEDKLGYPTQIFFRLGVANSSSNSFPIRRAVGSAPTDQLRYGEYLFMNSVAACDYKTGSCTGKGGNLSAPPEVWATLFNNGDEYYRNYVGGEDLSDEMNACNRTSDTSTTDPYYNCRRSANGPIAIPQPAHAFVGVAQALSDDCPVGTSAMTECSPPDEYAPLPDTTPIYEPGPNRFLLPVVLSSTRPRENGIKPVKRPPAGISEKVISIKKSGLLCRDYRRERFNVTDPDGGVHPLSHSPYDGFFGLTLDHPGYINTSMYSGATADEEAELDNDALHYQVYCGGAPTYDAGAGAVKIGTEPVVLQLDHDEVAGKPSITPHWPSYWFTGNKRDALYPASFSENLRQFFVVDHDGNGVGDSTWLNTENVQGKNAADREFLENYAMITGDLMNDSQVQYERARWPMSNIEVSFEMTFLPMLDTFNPTTIYTRIQANADRINPSYRFTLFDATRSTAEMGLHESFMVALDFDPYIRKSVAGPSSDPAPAPAGMYLNYVKSNRFRAIGGETYPLGIQAAWSILNAGWAFGELQEVAPDTEDAEMVDGQARVRFLNASKELCDAHVAGNEETPVNCEYLEVMVRKSFLGKTLDIRYAAPVIVPYLEQERCDPLAPNGKGCTT